MHAFLRHVWTGALAIVMCGAAARLPAQTIALAGVDAQGALAFKTSSAEATFRIPLELTAGKVKEGEKEVDKDRVDDFRLVVDDFLGPNSQTVPARVTIDGAPPPARMTIAQADRHVLAVSALFRVSGEYKSRIVLFYGGKRLPSIPLTVTRDLQPITLRVDVVEARSARLDWTGNATLRVTVQETAGQQVTIDPPALVNVALKRGEKVQREAVFEAVDLRELDATAKRPNDVCGQAAAPKSQKTSYTIQPQGHLDFLLGVCGLAEAGEYTGTIRITNRDGAPADKAMTVFAKEAGWIAFLAIFVGVLASYLLRRWTKEARPRLEAERRLADLEDDLDKVAASAGPLADAETRAIAGLHLLFDQARKQISRGNLTTGTAALDVLDRKITRLPDWLRVGRDVRAAERTVNVETIRRNWELIADSYFLSPAPTDAEFKTALDAIVAARDAALKDEATRCVTEFERRLGDEKAADPQNAAALDRDVKPLVDDARTVATSGKIAEAAALLMEAKAAFAKVLANALTVTLTKAAPVGFTANEWTALGARIGPEAAAVKTEADGDRAIQRYEATQREYLAALIDAARSQTSKTDADIDASSTIDAAKRAALHTSLGEVRVTLAAAGAHLANENARAATEQYQQAVTKIQQAMQAAQAGGAPLSAAVVARAGAAAMLPEGLNAPMAAATVAEREARETTIGDRLTGAIERYDLLINFAVLLIAAVIGMTVLWFDDPVWGGWRSYAVAFLWGLGVQQVGGAGFEGLAALTKKLTD